MLDILIIAHFTQVPGEKGNGRFHYIADAMDRKDASVEIVTSSFSHGNKAQRQVTQEQMKSLRYQLTLLYEPGYRKNVSLKRFYSHNAMGRNLKKYLEGRKKPDVLYCAVPSLDVAYAAAMYAKKNRIRFVIDIQDLWPEAFKMVFRVPVLSDLIFLPMKRKADRIYKTADEIIAVSQTYAERALRVNKKCKEGRSIFLGTDLKCFDRLAEEHKRSAKPKEEIWLVYIGTLGHSYDLPCVIDALKILRDRNVENVKFVVIGDGPLRGKFEDYAKQQSVYAEFLGRLDYGAMVGMLVSCDIAVNPICGGSAASIINKHGDYAAAGLPVINTQESPEYRNLVDQYHFGFNCRNGSAEDLAQKLLLLCENEVLRKEMSLNSRAVALELFDRSVTYRHIFHVMQNTIKETSLCDLKEQESI